MSKKNTPNAENNNELKGLLEEQIGMSIVMNRMKKNMTQKQLTEITGINQADISKLENGNSNPSIRTLKRIAEGLGLELKVELTENAKEKE